jgi:hypothetical protein
VLADIDGPGIFSTQLNAGPMRVLTGSSPSGGQGEVGDGPPIGYIDDMEFAPNGFLYLLTTDGRPTPPSLRHIMRIHPDDGTRSIVATIEPPLGFVSRFAFVPTGDLFVTLSFPADPNPLSSQNPMPPQSWSKILRVDVETGVIEEFPATGHRYDFSIADIAIGADGQALLLANSFVWRLDLTTGATSPHPGFFLDGRELDITADGTPVVLSSKFNYDGVISAFDADAQTWSTIASELPFNSPFSMALVPVPEPSAGVLVALLLAIAAAKIGSGRCPRF